MRRELVHDPAVLARPSAPATREDAAIVKDLLDTLAHHKETCVGMAANMIGEHKRIIAFVDQSGPFPIYTVMLNPRIVSAKEPYFTQESCLSLLGGPRPCKRYKTITVSFQSADLAPKTKTYTAFTAQIIQHEIDHCNGVLI